MIEDDDEAGNGSVQFPSLSRALDRSNAMKDPFDDSKPAASGRMRARAFAKIKSTLLEGNDSAAPRIPGTVVPVAKFERFIAALEKQAGARDSKIGRQAGQVLTFLRKDKQKGDDTNAGVNIAQFQKLLRMVARQTADGAVETAVPKGKARDRQRRQPA